MFLHAMCASKARRFSKSAKAAYVSVSYCFCATDSAVFEGNYCLCYFTDTVIVQLLHYCILSVTRATVIWVTVNDATDAVKLSLAF